MCLCFKGGLLKVVYAGNPLTASEVLAAFVLGAVCTFWQLSSGVLGAHSTACNPVVGSSLLSAALN